MIFLVLFMLSLFVSVGLLVELSLLSWGPGPKLLLSPLSVFSSRYSRSSWFPHLLCLLLASHNSILASYSLAIHHFNCTRTQASVVLASIIYESVFQWQLTPVFAIKIKRFVQLLSFLIVKSAILGRREILTSTIELLLAFLKRAFDAWRRLKVHTFMWS